MKGVKALYLKELSELDGVSGDEGRVREFIEKKIKDKVDSLKVDVLGNMIAFKKGTRSNRKFLLAAHMDEVGFMVTNIEDDGTLSFGPVGGIDPRVVVGKHVRIKGELPGVIGYKAIHLQKKDELLASPKFENLRINIGANSKEEASRKVELGDYVSFATDFRCENSRATGKAFDDRAGCAVLMEIIDKNERFEDDLYIAFLVQEETGLRGSAVLFEQLQPDLALVIEGTTAGDDPGLPEHQWATCLGDGPAITFMHRGYVVNKKIYESILQVAQKYDIKHQPKRRTAGGTDAARLAKTGGGVPAGVISVPARYIHSPLSVIDMGDFENTVKLVSKILEEGEGFAR